MLLFVFIVVRVFVFGIGAIVALQTFLSVVRTFILPRSAPDIFTRTVFISIGFLFEMRRRMAKTFAQQDRVMEMYAPISLLMLLFTWLFFIQLGYTAMFWSLTASSFYGAFKVSGSSLFTLGVAFVDTWPTMLLSYSEALLGLILVALLISYLPTIYGAFTRREAAVTLLEVRAGSPPSAVELIIRAHRLKRFDRLNDLWASWEIWFTDIEESHTSLGALSFFRSPKAERSWITAAGTVLDAAALMNALVDVPHDTQADLCIRAGYLALRTIANFFLISHNANPTPEDPIHVTRAEFDIVCAELADAGVPLKRDLEQAWRDFAGWRVNYDTVLIALAELVIAPAARWSSDRILPYAASPAIRPRKRVPQKL